MTRPNPWNKFIELLDALIIDGALKRKSTLEALERFASSFNEEVDRSLYRGELGVGVGRIGSFDEAERIVGTVESPHDRAHYWRKLAAEEFRVKEFEGGLKCLQRSEEAINTLLADYFWERAEVLSLNAELLDDFGLKQDALKTWEKGIEVARAGQAQGSGSSDCSAVMATMAKLLAEVGRRELAISVAKSITIPGKRELAYELIEKASPKN